MRKGATAVLGVGAVGTLSAGLAAGCDVVETESTSAAASTGTKYALNEAKYQQLKAFPDVRQEFQAALDEVTDGLLADPHAYGSFMESTDAIGNLKCWDANVGLLAEIAGEADGTTKRGRLKRILAVSELYDGSAAMTGAPGFLDSLVASSSSSSSVSSGGDCATNGAMTNGCCVIHTWGWSSGQGLC